MKGKKQDWFDDPEWQELKERVKLRSVEDVQKNRRTIFNKDRYDVPAHTAEPKEEEPHKIELKINLLVPTSFMARLKKLRSRLLKLKDRTKTATKKQLTISAAAVFCLVVIIVLFKVLPYSTGDNKPTPSQNQAQDFVVSHDVPFDLALPRGRSIDKEKIFYEAKRNFAKYDDEINSINITVSEQPLPESFKADPQASVEKVAKESGAPEKLTADGTILHYGLSDQGLQTIVLTKKDLLIFINTSQEVEKESLKVYANNLD